MADSATVKVVLTKKSFGAKAGDTVEVDKAQAERLVNNGHASYPDKK